MVFKKGNNMAFPVDKNMKGPAGWIKPKDGNITTGKKPSTSNTASKGMVKKGSKMSGVAVNPNLILAMKKK